MGNNQQSYIDTYKRLFFDENEYIWESPHSKDFTKFRVVGLISLIDKIRVSVEILDYRWDDVSKKLLDRTGLFVLKRQLTKPLKFDFSMCSITNFEIVIINESRFSLPVKQNLYRPEFKIYTGKVGFDTLRESSYIFQDDIVDDSKMTFSMALRCGRNR